MTNESTGSIIDEVDQRIIGELISDGRITYTALADRVGLSQAAVRARVQRLLDEQMVTVTARIDPATAGLAVFAFALLIIDEPARDVAKHLDDIPEAVFVAFTTGRWGILAELRCMDNRHLFETLDAIRSIAGVAEVESLTVMEYFKQDWTGLVSEVTDHTVPTHRPTPTPAPDLDQADRRIIEALIEDGRATYADIAPLVGLSQGAVRSRVRRLIEDEVVIIQAYANAPVLGIGFFAAGLVTVKRDAPKVVEFLCAMPEISLVAATSGRYDVSVEIWCRDGDHLLDIVDRIRSLDEVGVVATHTFLSIAKEKYRVSIQS